MRSINQCLLSGNYDIHVQLQIAGYIQLVQNWLLKWLVIQEIKNTKTMKKKPPIAIAWKEEDYNYKGLARLAKHYGPVYRIDMGIM